MVPLEMAYVPPPAASPTDRTGYLGGAEDAVHEANFGQVDVSEETAAEAVKQAQSSGASQGVLRELRLRFLVERRPDGELRIAFAECFIIQNDKFLAKAQGKRRGIDMSIETGRAYLRARGYEDRIQEFSVSSATGFRPPGKYQSIKGVFLCGNFFII